MLYSWMVADEARSFFDNEEFSDLTVSCNGREWRAHQIILFQKCPTLKKMTIASQVNIAGFVTKETILILPKTSLKKLIELDEYEADVVEAMLRHLYGTVAADSTQPRSGIGILYNVRLRKIANDLDCLSLFQIATENFLEVVKRDSWKQSTFVDDLKKIYAIEDESMDGLRKWLLDWILQNFDKVAAHHDMTTLWEKTPGLAVQMLAAKFSVKAAPPEWKKVQCPECKTVFAIERPKEYGGLPHCMYCSHKKCRDL